MLTGLQYFQYFNDIIILGNSMVTNLLIVAYPQQAESNLRLHMQCFRWIE